MRKQKCKREEDTFATKKKLSRTSVGVQWPDQMHTVALWCSCFCTQQDRSQMMTSLHFGEPPKTVKSWDFVPTKGGLTKAR